MIKEKDVSANVEKHTSVDRRAGRIVGLIRQLGSGAYPEVLRLLAEDPGRKQVGDFLEHWHPSLYRAWKDWASAQCDLQDKHR